MPDSLVYFLLYGTYYLYRGGTRFPKECKNDKTIPLKISIMKHIDDIPDCYYYIAIYRYANNMQTFDYFICI